MLCYTNIYFSHTQLSSLNILPLFNSLQILAPFFHFQKISFHTAGRAVEGVGLRPIDCCDCGFESRSGHESLFLLNVVYCQIEALRRTGHASRGALPVLPTCV